MLTFSLQSGSNGNSIYVEAGDVRLLFDAGISGSEAQARMAVHGRDIRACHAVIISHNHSDHARSAGIFQRKFGLPICATPRTHQAIRGLIGRVDDVRHFSPGERLDFGDVCVHTLRTPHDGVETVCFIVEHDRRRLGIFTDLGHPFAALRDALADLDAAYLESNYDPDMLWHGPYPVELKRRIAGRGGHLSNDEAAEIIRAAASPRLRWLALAHLSEQNNEPDLALSTHRRYVGKLLPLRVASRYEVGEVAEV